MMSKKTLGLFACTVIICLVAATGAALAASRFDTGFRGVSWGTPKDKLPDLGLSKKSLKNIYKSGPSAAIFMEGIGNLAMDIDGIPLLSIFMRFHDRIFCGVDLIFKPEDRDKIESLIAREMETEATAVEDGSRWTSGPLTILLTDRELMVSHGGYDKE